MCTRAPCISDWRALGLADAYGVACMDSDGTNTRRWSVPRATVRLRAACPSSCPRARRGIARSSRSSASPTIGPGGRDSSLAPCCVGVRCSRSARCVGALDWTAWKRLRACEAVAWAGSWACERSGALPVRRGRGVACALGGRRALGGGRSRVDGDSLWRCFIAAAAGVPSAGGERCGGLAPGGGRSWVGGDSLRRRCFIAAAGVLAVGGERCGGPSVLCPGAWCV
jgi:hypothetical protein